MLLLFVFGPGDEGGGGGVEGVRRGGHEGFAGAAVGVGFGDEGVGVVGFGGVGGCGGLGLGVGGHGLGFWGLGMCFYEREEMGVD